MKMVDSFDYFDVIFYLKLYGYCYRLDLKGSDSHDNDKIEYKIKVGYSLFVPPLKTR